MIMVPPQEVYRRSWVPMLGRLQPARFLLSAAVLLALLPSSLALFTGCTRSDGCIRTPSSAAHQFQLHQQCNTKLCSYYRDRSSIVSLSLSAPSSDSSTSSSTTTYGSSAVRSLKALPIEDGRQLQLLSFYRFAPIDQPNIIRDALFDRLQTIDGLRGTVYVAEEGINAQFAVPVGELLDELLQTFGNIDNGGCLPFDTFEKSVPNMGNVVESDVPTFDRLIVRTRNFILRDGIKGIGDEKDPSPSLDWNDAGTELDPSEWDEQLRAQSNVQLFDCRNIYESDQGTFQSAKPLNTQTFSDTWAELDSQVESQSLDPKEPVYIFCTGGIRCVKVGAYLKQKLGCDDVRSLEHGVIGYERWNDNVEKENETDARANQKDERESLWVGENFLFDKRRFAKEGGDISVDKN